MRGKLFAKLLNRFCSLLNDFRWPLRDFCVSIAMLIWSFIRLCELKRGFNDFDEQTAACCDNSLGNMLIFFNEHVAPAQRSIGVHQAGAPQQLLTLHLYRVVLRDLVEFRSI